MEKSEPRIRIEDVPQSASRDLKEEELRKVRGGGTLIRPVPMPTPDITARGSIT